MAQPLARPSGTRSLSLTRLRETLTPLGAFLGRRLLFAAVVLVAITYLTYLGLDVSQGYLRTDRARPAITVAARRPAVDTVDYFAGLTQGDLGMTRPGTIASFSLPVREVFWDIAPRSLGLLGAAFLVAIAIGLPLGAWAAARRHHRRALGLMMFSIVGVSIPSFFAALFLQIAAIQYTRTFGRSIVPVGGFGWDRHLVLPMLVLAARPIAQIFRITFIAISETFDRDFVRTARGKGLRSEQVFLVHIVRNAAVPILTTLVVSLRFSLSSLPVVEGYFGWGGIGDALLDSLFTQDGDLAVTLVLTLGVLFLVANLLLELCYQWIDPRLADREGTTRVSDRFSLLATLRSLPEEIGHFVRANPLSEWLRGLFAREEEASPFQDLGGRTTDAADRAETLPSRRTAWLHATLGNPLLLLGTALVAGLVYLTLFGPRLAPYSPNTTQILGEVNGVLTRPPLPPSEAHPWGTDRFGRDILSLVLAGAQQTMIMGFAVVIGRMILGVVLGLLAGWFHDSWLDRALMVLIQALSVFPMLLLAAIFIFIIGIQKGMSTFILALSLVGWGELTQFVRGEVLSLRPKPFIESAVAVGQRAFRLVLVHVIPNLAPALISLAALEMGAVLMLLGELGFIGIFLQGGFSSGLGLYGQVPEWGALLSNVREWTRPYPWTGFYPTAAFFVAILAFNLLGEGIRRLVDEVGLVMNRLINVYTVGAVVLLVVGFNWARGNTGNLIFHRQQSDTFSGARAMEHVEALTDPSMTGRALDSPGLPLAAAYIRDRFQELGLQPGGENTTFFQEVDRTYVLPAEAPLLLLDDGRPAPVYKEGYAIYPAATRNEGAGQGPVHVLVPGSEAAIQPEDTEGQVLLLLSEEDLEAVQDKPCAGVLLLAPDQSAIRRRYTLPTRPAETRACGPILWVSDRLTNRLLAGVGETGTTLAKRVDTLRPDEVLSLPTGLTATLEIVLSPPETTPVMNVIGHLPGNSEALDSQLIIVAAQYDGPPSGGGQVFPGANDNATGVAVMLETIRAMQESGYQPLKTFLFVAYSGEGLPEPARAPAATSFLQARHGFENAFDIEGVIYLRSLGVGQEDELSIWTPTPSSLSKLVESAAHLVNMETILVNDSPTMNVFAPTGWEADAEAALPRVGISLEGWERSARLASDTVTFVTSERLDNAGRAVTLTLMIMGREQIN